jgi:signal transduction histidine kinase
MELKMHDRLLAWNNMDDATAERSAWIHRQPRFDGSARVERAQRLADEAVAMISHELRTPLGAISHWAQVLQRAPGDQQTVLRAAEAIERNVRLQARLVDDLLDMSRINAGKLELARSELDLDEVIQASLATVEHAAGAKRIRLRCQASEPLRLRADARRLQQVLVNLLTNAIKFTPNEGQVSIRAGRQGPHAVVRVADSGQGIAADLLPFIFERFQQAKAAEQRHGGLGLGLHIVKSLVALHGGSVHAESAGPDRGAEFTVRLPCVAVREAECA